MKTVSIGDFLTKEQTKEAIAIMDAEKDDPAICVNRLEIELLNPIMDQINQKLDQENSARFLAYALHYTYRIGALDRS